MEFNLFLSAYIVPLHFYDGCFLQTPQIEFIFASGVVFFTATSSNSIKRESAPRRVKRGGGTKTYRIPLGKERLVSPQSFHGLKGKTRVWPLRISASP